MAAGLLPMAGGAIGSGVKTAAAFALLKDLIGPALGGVQSAVASPNQALQAGNTAAGKYTVSPSQEAAIYQSVLLQNALDKILQIPGLSEGNQINPRELINNAREKNLEALRETRTGEIALGELGVMSATNPAIARGVADVAKSGDELLGEVITSILSNANISGDAAVGQVI